MDPFSLKKLNECRRNRRAAILVTDLADASDRVVIEGEQVSGDLGDAVAAAFRSGKSGSVEAEGRSLFLNVHLPPPRLVIIGAVHISQALAPMAKLAGFDVHIIELLTAFAPTYRFPDVRLCDVWREVVLGGIPLDAYCALAADTHDPQIDDFPMKAALETNCFYVAALGSRTTH